MAFSKVHFFCFILCTCLAISVSQEHFFEMEDSEVNEVIFIGEKDIVMRCGVKSSQSAYDIKIEHNGIVIAHNNGTDKCVNYTITEVRSNDGGNYTCTTVYTINGTKTMTRQKQLHLNVHDSSSPQCFRNGTKGVPYKEGDSLFMSCYCAIRENRPCRWLKTDVATGTGELITSKDTTTRDKTIVRITVGSADNAIRFDCFSGSSIQERCSIGGTVFSSKDVVLNFPNGSDHSLYCFLDSAIPLSSPPSNTTEAMILSTLLINSRESSFNLKFLGFLVPIFVCSIAVLSFIVFISFKKRQSQTDRKGQNEADNWKDKALHYDRAIFTNETTSSSNVGFAEETNKEFTQDSSPSYESKIHRQTSTDKNLKYDEEGYHVYQELKY